MSVESDSSSIRNASNIEGGSDYIKTKVKSAKKILNIQYDQRKGLFTQYDQRKGPFTEFSRELHFTKYSHSIDQIDQIQYKLNLDINKLKESNSLKPKEVTHKIKELQSEAVKALGKVIADYNKEVIKDVVLQSNSIVKEEKEEVSSFVNELVSNSFKGRMIRAAASISQNSFINSLLGETTIGKKINLANRVVQSYEKGLASLKRNAILHFDSAIQEKSKKHTFTKIETESVNAIFKGSPKELLAKHAGVVGAGGIYLVSQQFDPTKAAKQIDEMASQDLHCKERKTIIKDVEITLMDDNSKREITNGYQSISIPLNAEFDEKMGLQNKDFGGIFGDTGVSASRKGLSEGAPKHLVNGYLHKFSRNIMLRFGILAHRFEKDPKKRKEGAEQMATELLKAAVVANVGGSENIKEGDNLNLTFMSMSLVTPDFFRQYILGEGSQSERAMWKQQLEILEELSDNPQTLTIDGKTITVKFDIIAFNTGVNAGAKAAGMGVLEEWRSVGKNMGKLDKLIKGMVGELEKPENLSKISNPKELTDINDLFSDVKALAENPFSRIWADNPHEMAAKLIILGNRLNDLVKEHPELKNKYGGIIAAVNCMSGKDRTGIAVATAHTFEEMRNRLGRYPTTEEMKKPEMQDMFVEIYKQMLVQYGGLEITQTNTDVEGFKVGKEAMLYPKSKAWKKGDFEEIIRLAKLTNA